MKKVVMVMVVCCYLPGSLADVVKLHEGCCIALVH
jgi:hypothetical protein